MHRFSLFHITILRSSCSVHLLSIYLPLGCLLHIFMPSSYLKTFGCFMQFFVANCKYFCPSIELCGTERFALRLPGKDAVIHPLCFLLANLLYRPMHCLLKHKFSTFVVETQQIPFENVRTVHLSVPLYTQHA